MANPNIVVDNTIDPAKFIHDLPKDENHMRSVEMMCSDMSKFGPGISLDGILTLMLTALEGHSYAADIIEKVIKPFYNRSIYMFPSFRAAYRGQLLM